MYQSKLNLIETEEGIKYVKDTFERLLAKKLNLTRVSAPIIVRPESGLNDDLNGIENKVSFQASNMNIEVVQSLAKWKRMALGKYGFKPQSGLYTDMNALRADEALDEIHSIYVDQWDWEKVITKEDRKKSYLFKTVKSIYSIIYKLALELEKKYGFSYGLPKDIFFISSKELENLYPNSSPKERENMLLKEHKAAFIYQIGWPLKEGIAHDGRAADYDDWKLNGDILVWNDITNASFELSSMGIRVDSKSLVKQLKYKKELSKLDNPYCKSIMNEELPYTIGGGIGQSRLCMFYLKKAHIGEVQSSIWPNDMIEDLKKKGIHLL